MQANYSKRSLFNLWLLLMLIWLLLNASLDAQVVVTGVFICALLSWLFLPALPVWNDVRWSPSLLPHYAHYFAVFFGELFKANLAVAALVFSPRMDIHPGIVEVRTRLTSPMGRLMLANSITLTPGTLVVEIRDDRLFVHWINVTAQDCKDATRQIVERFEKPLEAIYG